jgi:Zn finger protein HypA/HybF involved in hydrogenase expression
MGQRFEFSCEGCGYRAEVSGGGDAGYLVVTKTMTCLACKQVMDVVVGESHPGPLGSDIDIFGLCPRCRGRKVTAWEKDRPCPKCGGKMAKMKTGRVLFWD